MVFATSKRAKHKVSNSSQLDETVFLYESIQPLDLNEYQKHQSTALPIYKDAGAVGTESL